MKKKFVKVDVDDVRCYWVCENNDCKKFGKTDFYINPQWHDRNGTPVCEECDDDMHFYHVKVRK